MFNLTDVGLSMYVLQFIQIYFLNCEFDDWMQANLGMHIPFLVITWMERKVCDTLARREKFIITAALREKSEKIAWLAKVGIMLMLDNLIWREKFYQRTNPAWQEKDIMTHVLIVCSSFWSSYFTTLVLIKHFHCVIVNKHSMSLNRIKSNMRT
jgi:hypothetical protein